MYSIPHGQINDKPVIALFTDAYMRHSAIRIYFK